ncbi:MAG: DUF4091 domain-containing protein [Lentisphaerae bacterium]|nr:DUF4091 domain-containing protein [Lentisphaerota bacterium]
MKKWLLAGVFILAALSYGAEKMSEIAVSDKGEVTLENDFLKVVIDGGRGAMIRSFLDKRSGRQEVYNSVDKSFGSLGEIRFGGGSGIQEYRKARYKTEIISDKSDYKKIAFSYTPDSGMNKGIECRLTYALHKNRAVVEVSWQLINHSDKTRRLTPWIRNTVAGYKDIGISMDTNNLKNTGDTSLPTAFGHIHKLASGGDFFIEPARNWFARVAKEYLNPDNGVLYFVFDFNAVFQLYVLHFKYIHCMEMIFAPADILPGRFHEVNYSICSAGALKDVRFASTFAAADLERVDGKLRLFLSGTGNYGNVNAILLDKNGKEVGRKELPLLFGKVVNADFPDSPGSEFELRLMQGKENLLKPEYDPQNRFKMSATLNTLVSTKAAYVEEPVIFEKWGRLTAAFKSIEPKTHKTKYRLNSALSGLQAWAAAPAERIFEGDKPEYLTTEKAVYPLSAAGRERENFQIALHNSGKDELKDFTLRISGWEKSGIKYSWHPVEYVTTTQPSSFANYPVGRWPDVLLDSGKFAVPGNTTRCVWISFTVPAGTKSGVYPAEVELLQGEKVVGSMSVALRVFGFDLPRTPYFRTDVGGFFSKPAMMQMLKKDFNVTKGVKELERELFDHLLSRRLSPRGFIDGCKNIEKFEKELVRRIELGASSFFIPLGLSEKQRVQVEEVLKKHGVLKKSFVYAFDEIHAEQAPKVKKWCDNWHKKSSIPILVVYYGNPVEPLYGGIDIWCRMYNPDNVKLLTERVAAGDEVWFTNTPMFELEADIIKGRQNVWECFQSGMTGCLLWSCAPLSKNPFKQPFRSGTNLHGVLYYPVKGKNGLVPSVRLENFADAVDDFDYLSMLKKAANDSKGTPLAIEAEKLLSMPLPQTPEELISRRRKIGELIEAISKVLKNS